MKLPCGMGDLQKGERYETYCVLCASLVVLMNLLTRYTNMDYLFCSALKGTGVNAVNVSYDSACQWHHKLWDHMQGLPPELHLPYAEKVFTFFVPKFHLSAHITECQWKFSFNFIKGVGQTDGEAPE